MMNRYWWQSSNNKRVRWLAWERMCMAKSKGGMGFRSLTGFNLALLGKHVWNFMSNPNALVTRIYKAKYFHDGHLLIAKKGSNSSFIWTGLWKAKEELGKGLKWVLGDGNDINIFSDQWLRGK
ncbi:putative mitochondrial protein AtMg00310 [Apium graveolens]|uniref:putative mitochondrial protein AtMg00310 n=1 Tax=Apium graveolens TaxID=4045 RepID=UPI003D7B1D88